MTNEFKIISEDGLKTLCKAIKKTSTIGEIIDDDNSVTDKTYSSFKIDGRLNTKIDKTQLTTVLDESVTDEQIPGAKVVYDKVKDSNIKTYTALEQLGLTSGCTVQEVYIALPTPSIFVAKTINTDITDIPTTRGIIIVHKPIAGFVEVTFKETAIAGVSPNNMWLGSLKGGDGTGLTWSKVCTTTVADVSKTNIAFMDTVNFKTIPTVPLSYVVKNGLCTISGGVTCDASASTAVTISESMPVPSAISYGIGINTDNPSDQILVVLTENINGQNVSALKLKFGTAGGNYRVTFTYPVAE